MSIFSNCPGKGRILSFLFFFTAGLLLAGTAWGQAISFTPSGLNGESLNNPTSLQFGPDERLYVSQQNGFIYAYDVVRNGPADYQVTATETIDLIRTIPNHNEDGSLYSNPTRQITGILVLGTASNPILYVTSSDPRIGGGGSGNSTGLDENSGVISKLTWNGNAWDMVHLVRGLPRSEENHSLNGMTIDVATNTLYVCAGGNTNKGATSNNFAYLPELAYSAAILTVDLTTIESMTSQVDAQGQTYKYDLPTLDDEDKANVSNPSAGFEDVGDPWGGNNGKNQAMLVQGGPVQVYSSGWRNHYDVVRTQSGRLYTFDNGPNGGWGGTPINSCSNDANEANSSTKCDNLHYVSGPGYYGGHPNPTRANRNNTFNTTNPQTPIPLGMEDPFCDYRDPLTQDGALATVCSSTNGLCEYTASNFNNQLKGNLLAAAFNGNIVRFELNGAGDQVTSQSNMLSGFGATPLDVIAQPDAGPFPGTVWACTYGADNITIFEPQDFVNCVGNDTSFTSDFDGDGYSNGDELAAGTDQCSAGSQPEDFDGDFISDITDNDDDNDGILDNVDLFARDANNGATTTMPINYLFDNSIDPGINGWGFTGLMTDYTNDYMDLYDPFNMTVGGAALKFSIDSVPPGDALGSLNNQEYAFQFGLNVGGEIGSYTINGRIQGHFANQTPVDFQSYGFYIGTGDQDNYLKVVLASNGGAGGLEVVYEENGGGFGGIGAPVQSLYNVPGLLTSTFIDLYLTVDPSTATVQPKYSIDGGPVTDLGSPITIPTSWISNVLAVGEMATARGAGSTFPLTYDYVKVSREAVTATGNWQNIVPTSGSATNRHENTWVQVGDKFILVGGRGNRPVDIYDPVNNSWTSGQAPPFQMHHFQGIEYEGNLWIVGAFTGGYPNETPLTHIYIYNPATDAWHQGPEIPVARRRGAAGVVVHNDEIYVVCGIQNGHLSGWVPWVDKYNPQTGTWTQLADAPIERDHYHAAVYDNKIYNMGGRRTNFGGSVFAATVGQVDVYDIGTNAWNTLPAANNIPTERAGCFTGVIGDEIIVAGGESGTQGAGHEETEAFHVHDETWRSLDLMLDGRHGTSMIANNGVLYVAAGSGNRGGGPELNTIEAFSFFGLRPVQGTAVQASGLVSTPGNYDFGSVTVGNSSTETFTVTNSNGNQGIFITDMNFTGDPDWSYNFSGNIPYYLSAGQSITFDVTYSPTSGGGRAGSLVLDHTGSNPPLAISLIGGGFVDLGLYRINANGGSHTDVNGNTFDPDNFFTGGNGTNNTGMAIANTTDDPLYQLYRYGAFSYEFPLTDTGDYQVILHFSENWSGANGAGLRVFDVLAEGQVVLDDYDIWVEAGFQTAIQETLVVNVQDGGMSLQFVQGVQNPKIAAIEVIGPLSATGAALAVTPDPLHFFSQNLNTTSTAQDLVLTNTGPVDSTLTINSIVIGGTHAGDFAFSGPGLPQTLAGGSSLNVPFTFTPTAVGLRSAIIVIDHSGSTSPDTISLTGEGVVPVLNASINVLNDLECAGDNDGSLEAVASNGTSPFTYNWSNGGTTATLTNLVAGTYTVTITDAANQTATASVTLSVVPLLVQVDACQDNGVGNLLANASGGQSPYTYLWDANAGNAVTDTVGSLAAGTYTVTITDANACTVVGTGVINGSTPVCDTCVLPAGWANQDLGAVAATGASCYNAANDTWYVDGSGNDIWNAADEFQYAYTTLVGDGEIIARVTSITNTNQWAKAGVMMRESLTAGSKNAMMLKRGANGWSFQQRATDGTNTTFSGVTNQQIFPLWVRIERVGNAFTGYYSADGITWTQQGPTATIAMANTIYIGLAVTSHNDGVINNSIFDNVQVVGSAPLVATAAATSNFNGFEISCFGATDGEATVTPSQGVSPYTYQWDAGAGNQTTATATGLSAGTYSVTVTDAANNTAVASVTLTEPTQLLATTTGTDLVCNGDGNGTATVNITGGLPPYSIQWDAGAGSQATATATNLAGGTYTATITDANNCMATATVSINEPAPLAVTLTPSTFACDNISCNGSTDGSLSATVAGGTAPFTYNWGGAAVRLNSGNQGTFTAGNGDVFDADNFASAGLFYNQNIAIANTTDDALYQSERYGNMTYNIPVANGTYDVNLHFAEIYAPNQTAGLRLFDVIIEGNLVLDDYDIFATAGFATAVIETYTASVSDGSLDIEFVTVVNNAKISAIEVLAPSGSALTGLGAGTYTVAVTDANGCTGTATATLTEPSLLTASTALVQGESCALSQDGSATASGNGGCAPYTYAWDANAGNQTTATATGLAGGTYTVTVTDASGCTQTADIVVPVGANLTVTTTVNANVSCANGNDGQATANAVGGTAPYQYLWGAGAGSQTTATATGLAAGSYNVAVTDANGCSGISSVTISQPSLMVVNATANDVSCNGNADGSAVASATGGTPPYAFVWDANAGNQASATAINLSAGSYTVTITDANGCSNTATATVNEPAAIALTTSSIDVTCNGVADGSASVVAANGNTPYAYQWDVNAGNQTTATANNLSGGTYSVTVTDAIGCTATATVTLQEPAAMTVVLTPSTYACDNISCNGASDGSLTAAVTGGTAPYTYNWGGSVIRLNTGNQGAFTAGNGDVFSADNFVTGGLFFNVGGSIGNTTDDALYLSERYGNMVYSIPVGNGNYTVRLHFAEIFNGNQAVGDRLFDVEIEGSQVLDDYDIFATAGFRTAVIETFTASVSDGNLDIEFINVVDNAKISAIEILPLGSASQNGLPAGTYTVKVTDANGCIVNQSATLSEPTLLTAAAVLDQGESCALSGDGEATASATGGCAPYTYQWDANAGNQTTATATNLNGGNYTVTLTDASGCTSTASVNIPVGANLVASASVDADVSCNGGSDGQATVSIAGGSAPYSYQWGAGANNQTTATATGLAAGTYTVTVTDVNGCSGVATVSIAEPVGLVSTVSAVDANCNGGNDGSANVSVSGGTSPYTYAWSGSAAGQTSATATGLGAGSYTVTVTDANGCTQTATTTVNEPSAITLNTSSVDVTCNGDTDGEATVSALGGTSPYSILWDAGANNQTTATAAGLGAGTYSVTVTDANGCTESASVTVGTPAAMVIALTPLTYNCGFNVSCNGESDGQVSGNALGGTAPYTYAWGTPSSAIRINPGNGSYAAQNGDVYNGDNNPTYWTVNNIPAGTYTNNNILDILNTTDDALYRTERYAKSFSYDIPVSNGNYQVVLHFAEIYHGATGTPSQPGNVGDRIFNVSIEGNAFLSNYDIIAEVGSMTAVQKTAQVVVTDGTLNIDFDGIVDNAKVSAIEILPSGSAVLSNVAAGTYTLNVSDANGCTAQQSITLSEPDVLVATGSVVNGISCNGAGDGEATVALTGGCAPYTYAWDANANGQTTATATGLDGGTYAVTVTDANGCTATASVNLVEPAPLNVVASEVSAITTANGNDGVAGTTVTGGTTPYTYQWDAATGNQTTPQASNLSSGVYSVTVTDANGCLATDTVLMVDPLTSLTLVVNPSNAISCAGGQDGAATVTVIGGQAPYSYLWDVNAGNQTTPTATGLSAGTYTVTVTDNLNNVATSSVTLTEPSVMVATTAVSDVLCNGGATGSIDLTVSGATPGYTYAWSNGATTEDIANLAAGTYSVTVTDANACPSIFSATVGQPFPLTPIIQRTDITCTGANDGFLDLTILGGTAPFSQQWSTGSFNEDIGGLGSGTYSVTVTDANGCVATAQQSLLEPFPIGLNQLTTNVSCNGGNDGAIAILPTGGAGGFGFAWSNGATTQNIAGLTAGAYDVTLTDVNGCVEVGNFVVAEPAVIGLTFVETNPVCAGDLNGDIDLTVTGGTAPYSFAWSNNASTEDLNGIGAGAYTVTVTDANGCVASGAATLVDPLLATLNFSVVDPSCNGGTDGNIDLTVASGTAPYTFAWSNGATTEDITGLGAGTYSVTVTDANGCVVTGNAALVDPTMIVLTTVSTDLVCNGAANGAVDLTVSGGTLPYTFNWSNGATTEDLSGLTGGTFSVVVSDANGCTMTANATVIEPAPIQAAAVATAESCAGQSDGSVDLTVSNGQAPYTFAWSNGATSEDLAGLAAGTYSVVITDANGCTATASAVVSGATALTASVNATDVLCNGGANGTIDLTVIGGVGPYTYSWSNGATTEDLGGLTPGTYNVVITDVNGCTGSASAVISEPSPMVAGVVETNPVSCSNPTSGEATASGSGGTAPYTYQWSANTGNQISAVATGLSAGTYTVTVTDANICSDVVSITLTGTGVSNIQLTAIDATCVGSNDGQIVASNGTAPYTYTIATSGSNLVQPIGFSLDDAEEDVNGVVRRGRQQLRLVFSNNNQGNQTVGLRYRNVNIPQGATITNARIQFTTESTANTNPSNMVIRGEAADNSAGYTNAAFGLSSRSTTAASVNWSPANWNVVGQAGADQLTPNLSNVVQEIVNRPGWNAGNSLSFLVDGTGRRRAESWNGSAADAPELIIEYATPVFGNTNLTPGTYTVTVTDANGCGSTATVTINEPAPIVITANDVSCNGAGDGSVTATGGTGNLNVSVSQATINTLTNQISFGNDDAEQFQNGNVNRGNNDLELGFDNNNNGFQTVGMRFRNLGIPQGAVITNAYVQFTAKNGGNLNPSNLTIVGQDANNAGGIQANTNNLTNRPTTAASVAWSPANWAANQVGAAQRTPDLSSIVQEIVNRAGWSSGNNLLLMVSGQGRRRAFSYNGNQAGAPELVIEWTVPSAVGTTNLNPGTYLVNVTDANGCTQAELVTISQPATPVVVTATNTVLSTTGTSPDGEAQASVSGGTSPYTYNWGQNAGNQTGSTATGLVGGIYEVTVTDANGCSATDTVLVGTAVTPLLASANVTVDIDCNGDSNGEAIVAATGGVTPYAYLWDGNAGNQTTATAVGLSAGTYSVTVTDAQNTTVVATVTLTEPGPIALTVQDPLCFGENDGTVTATGGTGPYTYSVTLPPVSGSASVQPAGGNDDVEESNTGVVNNGSISLEMGWDNNDPNDPQLVGIRFPGLNIPQGAVITSANILFVAEDDGSGAANLVFQAEDVDDAAPFNTSNSNVANRPLTGTSVSWNAPAFVTGQSYTSADLSSLVQAVVNRGGWAAGNDLAMVISGTGYRSAFSFNAGPANAPVLQVNWSLATTGSVTSAPLAVSDDAEQALNNGTVLTNSTSLEMGFDNNDPSDPQLVGMRFPDITVPQGAVITGAAIVFTAESNANGTANLTFRAEASDDALTFSTANDNIGSRVLTNALVSWNVPNWTNNQSYTSPDLSSLVQEVVGRAGWASGNDLAVVVSGTGFRNASSFEAGSAVAPQLQLTWTTSFDADSLAAGTYQVNVTDANGCTYSDLVTVTEPAELLALGTAADCGSTGQIYGAGGTAPYVLNLIGGASASNQVVASGDDAEQALSNGSMNTGSSSLEIGFDNNDPNDPQLVGVRFDGVGLPQGANILSASLTFTSLSNESGSANFSIAGEDVDNAAGFTNANSNVSNRPATAATVAWNNVPAWTTGQAYTTPDLSNVVQEIVNRNGWAANNDMAFLVSGTGFREAQAFDGSNGDAPVLNVVYAVGTGGGSDTLSNLLPGIYQVSLTDANGCTLVDSVEVGDDCNPCANDRVEDGLIAFYPFLEGSGSIVHDLSGYGAPLDLTIADPGNVTWLAGNGVSINSGTTIASGTPAGKIASACGVSNEITVEAWVAPANTSQGGPTRIATMSVDPFNRNWTLGQQGNDYIGRIRTSTSAVNGTPDLNGNNNGVTTNLQHVVMTRNAAGIWQIYVDGVLEVAGTRTGDFSAWNANWQLALANELTDDRDWLGEMRLVAIYDKALSAGEIQQNYTVGAGCTGNYPPVGFCQAEVQDCENSLSVDFDGSNSIDIDGQIVNYAWDFGDGNGSTQAVASHTYTAGGTYNVVLTLTDNDGLTSVCNSTVTVTANPAGRVTSNLVAYYTFTEGSGNIVHDYSGFQAPLDLTIADPGNVSWVGSSALSINSGTTIQSILPASKVASACGQTNEITVEAWVSPSNISQGGPSRLVTMSNNTGTRNWTLGVQGNDYIARIRTTNTGGNGTPDLNGNNNAATTNLQHVAFTRDANGAFILYVDGVAVTTGTRTGNFSNWDNTWELALANELTNDRDWLGEMHLVAVYNDALSAAEIQQNFSVGPECEGAFAPVAFCQANAQACSQNLEVEFFGNASSDPDGQIVGYAWDFGDGNSSSLVDPVHNYAIAGTYTATLIVTDNDGNLDTCSTVVTVSANAGSRVTTGLIALYPFTESGGSVVHDYSGYQTPLDLTIADPNNVSWVGNTLSINSGTIIKSSGPAAKINTACGQTNEITVEAWVASANLTQGGPTRIATHSVNTGLRNWTLGQEGDDYISRVRTTATTGQGTPDLNGNNNAVATTLQHVVFTRDAVGAWTLYVDGAVAETGTRGGDFSNWDSGYEFALANELTNDRDWLGDMHLVAVYNVALSQGDIQQNFAVGPECGIGSPIALCAAAVPACSQTLAVDFTGSASSDPNGQVVSYAWDFGDGNGSTQADPTHTYVAVGTYTATLTVTDNDGNTGTCSSSITINPNTSSRVVNNIVAYYPFTEGSGNIVHDYSGVGAPLDLTIQNTSNVNWIGNDALSINTGVLINSGVPASKVHTACGASNAITIEAWVKPDNTTQGGPSRMVSNSSDTGNRNWTLHQSGNDFGARLRTTAVGNNGTADMNTPGALVTTTLHHVVYTRAANGSYAVYVDGVLESSGNRGGNFGNWNTSYQLGLANELTANRPWLGDMHLVAIYSEALTAAEVATNFNAGPDCDPPGMNMKSVAGAEAEVPGLEAVPTAEAYPNPFNGSFNFRFESPETFQSVEVQIYDALGQEVYTQRYGSDNGLVVQDEISLTGFTKGTYLMVVTSGSFRKQIALISQ